MAATNPPDHEGELVAVLMQRCERNAAQRDAALEALRDLVAYVERVSGFMEHKDQETLWRARAVLVEAGR